MLVTQLPCTGDLEMVERSEFHFNESYLVARAEINQTSIKKKKKKGGNACYLDTGMSHGTQWQTLPLRFQ